jgi:alpha-L-rhamnosidase
MKKIFIVSVLAFLGIGLSLQAQNVSVENLRCEYLNNPLGIDIQHPRLSWELSSDGTNKAQKAYQVVVSTDAALLDKEKADAWDSKKINSKQTNQITYQGKALQTNTMYYWKVRVWDEKGKASDWSETAHFWVGPLSATDWKAQWIGEKEYDIPIENKYYKHSGFRSIQELKPDVKKWLILDLGKEQTFDELKLYAAYRRDKQFPLRFSIELASSSDFSNAKTIVNELSKDVIVASTDSYYKKFTTPLTGRYIRLNVDKLAFGEKDRDGTDLYEFALAEIEVLYDKQNLALHCPVTISDPVQVEFNWLPTYFTDGKVLTDGFFKPNNTPAYSDKIPPSPLLRKEIQINKKVKSAYLSATAMGYYEAYINGNKAGNQVLAPEFTDYDSHHQFQTYDVTDLLVPGVNVLGAMLADGWYVGARWSHNLRGGYGFFRKYIGQLFVTYEDGTSETIGTDNTWKYTPVGPVTEASLFKGEIYEARNEHPGWDYPGFNDSEWLTVTAYPDEKVNLVAQMNEPLAVINELKPVSVHKIGHNKYIFDMGQNMVGWCRLSLPYNPGQRIRFQFGEMLYEDGSLYTDNLRAATQVDLYIPADGQKAIVYEPRFTYHGFRYVEIDGLTQAPQTDNLLGKVVASSSPIVGSFACSSKDVTKLWENIRWTQWGNLTSFPTDCPQRDEREGWSADAQIFSQTAIYNLDMAGFYTKWARDLRDSQRPDGRFPDIAPHDGVEGFFNSPGWSDAGVVIPWRLYQNYGDITTIAQQYEAMKKYVDCIYERNPDLLWLNFIGAMNGDWLNGNTIQSKDYPKTGSKVPNDVFATAYFAHSTQLLANSAKLLGKTSDYQHYNQLATSIRQAFVKNFVTPDGKIKGDTQAGYAMALHMQLLPENLRAKAAANMVEAVKAFDYRISTGIHATIWLMNQLSEYGYSDVAYRLLTSHRFPSWLYSVDQGSTTIWERWDGYVAGRGFQDPGMNSFNHVAIGAVGEWLYSHILGIQLDETQPGFRHFYIKPVPGADLEWATGSYHAITGNIEVSWTDKNDTFTVDVTVPANTTATVVLPFGGKTYQVGSGKHRFTAKH